MTTDPDLLPLPEAPAPDPLLALAMALDTSAGFDEVAALDPQPLTELAAMAVSVARSEPDTAWALRLDALRRVLMMQNMRPQYALVLAGMADVAEDLEDWPGARPRQAARGERSAEGALESPGDLPRTRPGPRALR
jgi:hypothetical protein